jgi:hypothetical protein
MNDEHKEIKLVTTYLERRQRQLLDQYSRRVSDLPRTTSSSEFIAIAKANLEEWMSKHHALTKVINDIRQGAE